MFSQWIVTIQGYPRRLRPLDTLGTALVDQFCSAFTTVKIAWNQLAYVWHSRNSLQNTTNIHKLALGQKRVGQSHPMESWDVWSYYWHDLVIARRILSVRGWYNRFQTIFPMWQHTGGGFLELFPVCRTWFCGWFQLSETLRLLDPVDYSHSYNILVNGPGWGWCLGYSGRWQQEQTHLVHAQVTELRLSRIARHHRKLLRLVTSFGENFTVIYRRL